ncbi:MAG: corrinoid protein [Firmicutes bacterium]|nr:corrinoid protein [Bacillota bacterium]
MNTGRNHIFQQIITAILAGKADLVLKSVSSGLAMNISAMEIMEYAIMPATKQLAVKFQGADFYIPDVLLASRAIKAGLYALKPLIQTNSRCLKKIVIGTVAGDIHDIGKNMVSLFLSFSGFEVIDLGVDVTAVEFVQAVKKYRPSLLGLSALLTTTIGEMGVVIEQLNRNHLRHTVKILVGGAPVTKEFAAFIGADAYAQDAQEAVKLARELVRQDQP